VVLNGLRGLDLPLNSLDEALNLVLGEKVLEGGVAGRDFFTLYSHGGYFVMAEAFRGLGVSAETERLVGLTYHLAIVLGIVYLARRLGHLVSLAAGLLAFSILSWIGTAAFPWFGGLALSIWSLALVASATRARRCPPSVGPLWVVGVAGVLASLCGSWRVEMLALALAPLPMLGWSRRLVAFAFGALAGLTPLLWWAGAAGPSVLKDILFMRGRVDFQARLSDNPPLVWVLLGWSLLGLALVLAVVVRRRQRFELSLIAFCVLLVPQMLQRLDMAHVVFSGAVIAPLVSVLTWSWLGDVTGASSTTPATTGAAGPRMARRVRLLLGWSLLVVLVARMPALVSGPTVESARISSGSRTMPVGEEEADLLADVLAGVRSVAPAGSRLFVGSQDLAAPSLTDIRLYYLLPEYQRNAYFLYLPPGVAGAAGSGLAQDIDRSDVAVLCRFGPELQAAMFPRIPRGSEDANEVVRQKFLKVRSVGGYDIYVRKATDTKPAL
jgi:hypothetical protein